eukprot:contig_1783_g283
MSAAGRATPAIARVAPGGATRSIVRRPALALQQRLLIITQVADGIPLDILATRYGVSRRAISRIHSCREQTWRAADAGVPYSSLCAHPAHFPLVDEALLAWFLRLRSAGLPVSRLALQVKAVALAGVHYPGAPFRASNGYIQRWRTRSGVRSIRLHGAGGAVNVETAEMQMKELRDKLIGVDPDLLLNMDEAALYYQLAPTNSYVLARHARETRGTALQHAKARLT